MRAGSSKGCNCSFLATGRPVVDQAEKNSCPCQSIEGALVDLTRIQVPPCAPKEKSSQSGWLFSFGAAIFAFGELNLLCKRNWLSPAKLPFGSNIGEYNLADAYGINIAFTK